MTINAHKLPAIILSESGLDCYIGDAMSTLGPMPDASALSDTNAAYDAACKVEELVDDACAELDCLDTICMVEEQARDELMDKLDSLADTAIRSAVLLLCAGQRAREILAAMAPKREAAEPAQMTLAMADDGPGDPPRLTPLTRGWHRAWAIIHQRHGADPVDGEHWQYMSTFDGEHEFRNRALGRDTVRELDGDYEAWTAPDVTAELNKDAGKYP